MNTVDIKGHPGLVRDIHSKAVLNTNRKSAEEYMLKTKTMSNLKSQTEEINTMKQKIEELSSVKEEMQHIKSMLEDIYNKIRA